MLGRLILLFLLTPAIELGLLIQVDRLIGFWPTIGLIIVTGLVGSYLARREGTSTWLRLNRKLSQGGLPGNELIDGVIILVAGALLITPGVLTDVIGFIGLVPLTRTPIRNLLMKRFKRKMEEGTMHVQFGGFGVSSPSSSGSAPHRPDANGTGPDGSGDGHWEGIRRDVPDHADAPSDDDPDATR
jgi:UPF0716 protein FxsA